MFFESGSDYFCELPALGLHDQAAIARAAPTTWRRLGGHFMRLWKLNLRREVPWAFKAFGPP